MNREQMLDRLRERIKDGPAWDIVVIGGGATGLGIAVDAAARGYGVALLEGSDFAKGTSSRSTKLVHGGVRYLQQGNISLVMEALKERGILRRNAPHLVHDLAFIVPSYDWWESPFYGVGMKVYDALAGRYGFGRSRILSRDQVVEAIPTIETDELRGGVLYYDGQFDDARLAIALARTAAAQGATLVNYAPVVGLTKDADGRLVGVVARDDETGEELRIAAKVVINATGAFADRVRRLDDSVAAPIIAPSQGVHIVLDRSFLPGKTAIMVPHTRDGRVMFAIPWRGRTIVGTTDTPIQEASLEPTPFEEEISFILETANRYLARPAARADIRSVFAGIRPLVKTGEAANTAALSRDHTVQIDPRSGLMTIAGGKWTTYRKMAQDAVDQAATLAELKPRPCPTRRLQIHGYHQAPQRFGELRYYGSDATEIEALARADASLAAPIHRALPITGAEIVWAARHEMARTVDDALARRTRALLLEAKAASEAAEPVARLLARELGRDDAWAAAETERFRAIAARYIPA